MEYFKILNLNKEPFSNSPDPEFFFQSRQHLTCLQKLEISLRLRRGLNVVIGDVGTGKTTLCRQIIRQTASDEIFETHLILDPCFKTPLESLAAVAELFNMVCESFDDRKIKEAVKQYLFQKGVEEKKITVLIIDEGQKLPVFFIEILREFLNYETNEYKLLQIIIFAQKEFEETLNSLANFADRISLYHILQPLNFYDMKKMIQFRLNKSMEAGEAPAFFTWPALWKIYQVTGGYPRKIINLCHQSILMMIIQNRPSADWFLVKACAGRRFFISSYNTGRIKIFIFFFTIIFSIIIIGAKTEYINSLLLKISSRESSLIRLPGKESSHNQEKIPYILGHLAVQQDETLGELVRNVYGSFSPLLLQKVIEANPDIKSANRISIAQNISFPALPIDVVFLSEKKYAVEIINKETLKDAFGQLRTYDKSIPLRLIPYWNEHEKLKFMIIYEELFSDETSALARMNALQTMFSSRLKIINIHKPDTIFFADPFKSY